MGARLSTQGSVIPGRAPARTRNLEVVGLRFLPSSFLCTDDQRGAVITGNAVASGNAETQSGVFSDSIRGRRADLKAASNRPLYWIALTLEMWAVSRKLACPFLTR